MKRLSIIFVILVAFSLSYAENTKDKNKEQFKHVVKGNVENIKISIGSPESLIVRTYGEPLWRGYLSGGLGYFFDDFGFFTDSTTIAVTSIHIFKKGLLIGGIKIGTKLSKIRKLLGKPTFYGFVSSEEGEEIHPDKWLLVYNLGEYLLFYAADKKDGISTSGELRKNFECMSN